MKTNRLKILIMILFIILGITLAYAQQKEQTFTLGKNGQIIVKIDYGDIKIDTWGKDQVAVKYDEDDETANTSFRIVQNGTTLTITSGEYSNEDLYVNVPSSINLDLSSDGGDIIINGNISGKMECTTAGGDIETKDITGNVNLKTAGGEVRTGKVSGDAVISSGGGDLSLGEITGEAILNTGGGNIRVFDVGKALKIKTGGGNVKAGSVGGPFTVTTGGGNVIVKKVSGGFKVTTGGGNVTVEGSKGKALATTGGGNLSLKGISGEIECSTGFGDVYVELNPGSQSDSKIESGSGNITLYLPADVKATVIAKVHGWASWGGEESSPVISEFENSTEEKSSNTYRTTYVLNGGGGTIEIETTSGEIYIKKQK